MTNKKHWRYYEIYKESFDLSLTTRNLLHDEVIKIKNSSNSMINSKITCKMVLNHPDVKTRIITEIPKDFPIAKVLGMQLYDIIDQDKNWDVKNLGDKEGYLYIKNTN